MQRASMHEAISLLHNSTFEWMKMSSFWWWWVHDRGNEEALHISPSVKYHLTFFFTQTLSSFSFKRYLPLLVMELNWPPAAFTVASTFSWRLSRSYQLDIGKLGFLFQQNCWNEVSLPSKDLVQESCFFTAISYFILRVFLLPLSKCSCFKSFVSHC